MKKGKLENKCKADPSNFPKCGDEGCVYLDGDNVIKQQWKSNQQMNNHDLSIEGQSNSALYSPNIVSESRKPCDLISIIGKENKAPCFVKRVRKTRKGEKVIYENEKRDSWCRNYGANNQCLVDNRMFKMFNKMNKVSHVGKIHDSIKPEVDDFLTGDDVYIEDEIEDEEDVEQGERHSGLGELLGEVETPEGFTYLNPVYFTELKMGRIKGITINELISEMIEKLGPEEALGVAGAWESEKEDIIRRVNEIGYTSPDFNENNIMIDVEDENLCSWIDEKLKEGIAVTPDMIKDSFEKENILKIVDWGLLKRTKAKSKTKRKMRKLQRKTRKNKRLKK
jgi:hypothetical protein